MRSSGDSKRTKVPTTHDDSDDDRKLPPSGGAKRLHNRASERSARARKKVKEKTAELYQNLADATDTHVVLQEQHNKLVALVSSLTQENQRLRQLMEQNTAVTASTEAGHWGESGQVTKGLSTEVATASAPVGLAGLNLSDAAGKHGVPQEQHDNLTALLASSVTQEDQFLRQLMEQNTAVTASTEAGHWGEASQVMQGHSTEVATASDPISLAGSAGATHPSQFSSFVGLPYGLEQNTAPLSTFEQLPQYLSQREGDSSYTWMPNDSPPPPPPQPPPPDSP